VGRARLRSEGEATRRDVEVGGTRVATWQLGEAGDPLVLLHGAWVDHRTFDRVAPLLSQTFQVTVLDRPGYGASAPAPDPYDFSSEVATIADVIEQLDLQPVHVVGHSLGGSLSVGLAASRPDLLRGLVVHEPPMVGLLDPSDPDLERFRAAARAIAARLSGGDVVGGARQFLEEVAEGPGAWERLPRASQMLMVDHALRWLAETAEGGAFGAPPASVAEFYGPALVTNGARSEPWYGRVADRLAERLPNVLRQTLPSSGHLPQVTDPGLFVGVVLSFCAERVVPTS
jgi:pimeloyl-ACP methyl ester carboxylesterase